MKELLREKGLWISSWIFLFVLFLGFPFSQIETPLNTGSFIKFYQEMLHAQAVLFFIPILSVLPVGAAYVKDSSSGFLKFYITRMNRMEYIKRKTYQIYMGGFLPFFFSGMTAFLICFLFLFPLEIAGSFLWEDFFETLLLLLRICLTGGILAEISGIFAVLCCNYYMAYGLPFVCYYMLVILKERYLPDMYAMYPGEWIVFEKGWGADGSGIWIFFAVFSLTALWMHALLLYVRLQKI